LSVKHKEYHIAFVYGELHLSAYLVLKNIITIYDPSSGIDDGKFAAAPFRLAVLAVAGGACRIAYYGAAGLGKAVEKSRFANIGPTYYGYYITHVFFLEGEIKLLGVRS
jgi:hypothetical protein